MATQKLMTAALRNALPPLYANEHKPLKEAMVVGKFFSPYSNATWWLTEFDGEDNLFGFVDLGMTDTPEAGYISLSELESIKVFGGVQAVERDTSWKPTPWGEVLKELR